MSIVAPHHWLRTPPIYVGASLIVALVVLTACSKPPAEVPKALLGTWVTDAPTHADRVFIVRPDALVFGTGAYSAKDAYAIDAVEPLTPSDGWTPFRISIRELDTEITRIEVAHRRGATPELRFLNRPEIWRPEGAIPDPARAAAPKKDPNDAWMRRERGNG